MKERLNRIARIHYEGVKLELATIGLYPNIDYDFFRNRWQEVGTDNVKTFPIFSDKTFGFIAKIDGETMLYVDKNHFRENIGSVLLSMEDVSNVWIIDGNYRAEGFYKNHGFIKTDTQRIQEQFGEQAREFAWERNAINQ
jgi:hypothetical protein